MSKPDVAAGLGVGANVLIGGTGKGFIFQPISVEGEASASISPPVSAPTSLDFVPDVIAQITRQAATDGTVTARGSQIWLSKLVNWVRSSSPGLGLVPLFLRSPNQPNSTIERRDEQDADHGRRQPCRRPP